MGSATTEFTLKLSPVSRFELIDVTRQFVQSFGNIFTQYKKSAYYSYHTTAGYLEQSLCERLNYNPESVHDFVSSYQRLFPPGANYSHDELHLRSELSEEQRQREPRNADSHLTFIGAGLTNCVTYLNQPATPVYFIDLDGVYRQTSRCRQTTVVLFNREENVAELGLQVPVSNHSVDSVNLKSKRIGLFEQLQELVDLCQVGRGRLDITLDPEEENAALTVNEYETLLMKYDLAEVLRNPLRFMAEKWKHVIFDPRAVPSKAVNYAKYDLVRFFNATLDALGLEDSIVERFLQKFLAVPASRLLRMKRTVSLLVSEAPGGKGSILQGTYQSPVLVQWGQSHKGVRKLRVNLVRFV